MPASYQLLGGVVILFILYVILSQNSEDCLDSILQAGTENSVFQYNLVLFYRFHFLDLFF